VEVLAVQVSVTEWDTGWTPVPDSVTDAGELEALLTTVTPPVIGPVADGANVTLRVAVCPGATICPDGTPLAVYPAPETVTVDIVTLEFPPFVNTTGRTLLLPILTLEKLRLVLLALRTSVAAFTVSVPALLVVLPAPLVTVTVNCSLLFPVVVAGVVYEVEVAPLMALPFIFHW
jgi:hypothetical protein